MRSMIDEETACSARDDARMSYHYKLKADSAAAGVRRHDANKLFRRHVY